MNGRNKWSKEYRESQDCPNTWDGASLERGYEAGFLAALERAGRLVDSFAHCEGMGTLIRGIGKGEIDAYTQQNNVSDDKNG